MSAKEYNHDYYLKNRKRIRKQQKKYFIKNHEKILDHKRQNKEQHKNQQRIWRENNREKVRDYERKTARELKMSFIQLLGGKCTGSSCGGIVATYDNLVIFEFHHINPKEKEYKREASVKSFIKKIRAKKIRLFCSNCHKLEHWKLRLEKLSDV
jgi:hypothetical protein